MFASTILAGLLILGSQVTGNGQSDVISFGHPKLAEIALREKVPNVVPLARSVISKTTGMLSLPRTIYVADKTLFRVAQVLSDEIFASTGSRCQVTSKRTPRTILLGLSSKGSPESYFLSVRKDVTITAATPQGVSWGSVTLLQIIRSTNRQAYVPECEIIDHPGKPYRGLMIDVARRWHSVNVLKQCVELCHFYKLNYLQLHLSDDQAFTFPSKSFPEINRSNQHGGPSYTVAELKDLVQYADDRGVAIVPEMDIPGHSATLNRTMPDLFKIKGTQPYEHHASINFVNEKVLRAVDTLIGEMCEVFHSSPYFHMGGDEADIALADQHPDFQAAFKKLGLPPKSQQELFRRFIGQVDEMVKRRGKKLIVWEGFGRDLKSRFPIPKDVLVMEFENAYYLPQELLKDGFSVVNASWTPLYVVNRHVWPAKAVYDWNVSKFGRFSNLYQTTEWTKVSGPRLTQAIQGAQACSWEGPEENEIETLRRIVAAMSERIWNLETGGSYLEFSERSSRADQILEKLIHRVEIRSSKLDAVDPSGFDVACFAKPLRISLHPFQPGTVRFTKDGKPPTGVSPIYQGPIEITQTTTIRAAEFDVSGKQQGFESSKTFYYVASHTANLAVGKKVTVSGGTQGGQVPELVVDDNLDLASSWWAGPAPQWLQVDLGRPTKVSRIEVFPYWDGSRYYQYTVEISADGKSWTKVADRSHNTVPSSNQGDEIRISPQNVRFVKVNMIRGSANDSVHLVEVRVWK